MIKGFRDKRTRRLYSEGAAPGLPPDVQHRAWKKLADLDTAIELSDLTVSAGNRLHALRGDRAGQYAIRVNDRWRICFRFIAGDAYDVEFCDYH